MNGIMNIWQPGIRKKQKQIDYKSNNSPANYTLDKYTLILFRQKRV